MINKKILIIVIAVGVLIVVSLLAVQLIIKSRNPAFNTETNQQNGATATPAFTPLLNDYFLGVVTKVKGSVVYVEYDRIERTVEVGSETKIIKQVPDEVKLVKLVDVGLDEIKAGDEVVVYFKSGLPLSEHFQAYKLQVL